MKRNLDDRKEEEKLLRLMSLEYLKDYCMENGISLDKLKKEKFILAYDQFGFFHPSEKKPKADFFGCDMETIPKATLLMTNEDGELQIMQTEYTKEFLSID